ncbi:hypothetical protein [Ralstonia mannitolilytica]|nr:hypothetical protein [Ralstonia mannitolilytica]
MSALLLLRGGGGTLFGEQQRFHAQHRLCSLSQQQRTKHAMTNDAAPHGTDEIVKALGLREQIDTADVLAICIIIGKALQTIDKKSRERAVTRLANMAEKCTDAEMRQMLLAVATSLDDFDPDFWAQLRQQPHG